MSRAFITRTFIVGALVAATACSNSESSTGPQPADHGLVQVDTKPIPFVLDNGPPSGRSWAGPGRSETDAVRDGQRAVLRQGVCGRLGRYAAERPPAGSLA